MAEFFVFNEMNWRDVPSKDRPDLLGYDYRVLQINDKPMLTADRLKMLAIEWQRYVGRCQPEDIVEVRRDGSPGGRMENSFVSIKVPIAFDSKYMEPLWENAEKSVYKYKQQYKIDLTGLDKSKKISLTVAEFNDRLKVKK